MLPVIEKSEEKDKENSKEYLVTCTDFIKGKQLNENSMNQDQNKVCTSLLYIESIYEV